MKSHESLSLVIADSSMVPGEIRPFLENASLVLSKDKAEAASVYKQVNEFIDRSSYFEYELAQQIECFRRTYEGEVQSVPPPMIDACARLERIELLDPSNGTFEVRLDIETGIHISEIITYICSSGVPFSEEQLLAQLAPDGSLYLQDEAIEDRLLEALRAMPITGQTTTNLSGFQVGNVSKMIWLLQTVSIKVYSSGDYRNYPFDAFALALPLSIGLGASDCVYHSRITTNITSSEFFKPSFTSGEFEADRRKARIELLGYAPASSSDIRNIMLLHLPLRRKPQGVILRIIVPLAVMAAMLFSAAGAGVELELLALGFTPMIFLATVALQLTAASNMPRGAPASRIDRLFVLTYLCCSGIFGISLFVPEILKYANFGMLSYTVVFTSLLFVPSRRCVGVTVKDFPAAKGPAAH